MDEPTSPVVAVPDEPTRRSGGALKGIALLIVLAAAVTAVVPKRALDPGRER